MTYNSFTVPNDTIRNQLALATRLYELYFYFNNVLSSIKTNKELEVTSPQTEDKRLCIKVHRRFCNYSRQFSAFNLYVYNLSETLNKNICQEIRCFRFLGNNYFGEFAISVLGYITRL